MSRSLAGILFLFALLFASSIEALTGHHHADFSGGRSCAVCQVVQASADTPELAIPARVILPENPCGPDNPVPPPPDSSGIIVLRLRAPPAA
jgi:hypothetical protein